MKSIVTDYLQHRLPANENFIKHLNGEMNTYLTLYLATLFPDSGNKAYILSGLEREVVGSNINFSEGVIFYDNEIFYVTGANFNTSMTQIPPQPGFVKQTTFGSEEYGNGTVLNAYENRQLAWSGSVDFFSPLYYDNMIRKDCFKRELEFSKNIIKKEGKIIPNHSSQSMIIHVKLSNTMIASQTLAIFDTGFAKNGFLGYGKVTNHTKQQTCDIAVYQFGELTALTLQGYHLINSELEAMEWGKISSSVEFDSGDEVFLYINVVHERV
jgi:hypothetical protein